MDPYIYEAFKQRHPHTTSLDALFGLLRAELTERLAAIEVDESTQGRALIGLAIELRPSKTVSYNGTMSAKLTKQWLETRCELPQQRTPEGNFNPNYGEPGFKGKVWFRLDEELPPRTSSVTQFFEPNVMHVGGGGYSTWEGPWNEFGTQLEKRNVGIPWGQKGKLAAYCYDIHFFISDVPGLDHMEVMLKMQDREFESKYYFEWQRDNQAALDENMLCHLDRLQEEMKAE